jgi:hypothetical protein
MKKEEWDINKIKDGFEKFKLLNGRLPTAPEIDNLDYLPSSRQIQRKFGGLEHLRKLIGYQDAHFGKGLHRSKIAHKSNSRGRGVEIELEKILRKKFGEVFVHTEKIFDNSKNRVDFFIYTPDGNFGVDIFATETIKDLNKNINIKLDKYTNFTDKLYFVVSGTSFSQSEIDQSVSLKKKSLGKNTFVVNLLSLQEIITHMKTYPDPLS